MRWVDPKAPADDPRHPGNAGFEPVAEVIAAFESGQKGFTGQKPREPAPPADPPEGTPPAPKKAPKRRAARKPADLKTALDKLNKTKGTTT